MITALILSVQMLVPVTGGNTVSVPSVESLVKRVDDSWDALRIKLNARMTVTTEGKPESSSEVLIRRAEQSRTRIDFLSPARNEGKVILQIGDDTWLYLPRADRVLKARKNPFAGLFPGRIEPDGATVDDREDAFVLVTPASRRKDSGTIRTFFNRSSLLPYRREIYSRSGKLLETVQVDETRDWRGVAIPWRVRFIDNLRRGSETRIEVLAVEDLDGNLEELFSKDHLGPASHGTSAEPQ